MSEPESAQRGHVVQAVLWPLDRPSTDELRLDDIRNWLVRGRLTIIVCVVLATVAAVAYAFLKKPVYRAETVMVITEENRSGLDLGALGGGLGGVAAGLMGISPDTSAKKEEFIALLRSRAFTEEFIREENLMPVLFESRWDAEKKAWKGPPKKHPTLYRAYRLFDKKVRTIEESRASGLVTVSIEWRDNELAASWTNKLIERLNAQTRARAIADARKSLDYLNRELVQTDVVELRSAISRLVQTELSKITMATVQQEYAFKVLDPARPPDRDAYVRPQRLLVISLGLLGGILLGVAIALARGAFTTQRSP
jgi:uncharacterized protein involved in exopolysaccharide biosynthesis